MRLLLHKQKKALIKLVLKYLNKRGYTFEKQSNQQDLANFLYSLKPKKTHHQLIRIGPEGDGGYMLPDDLEGINFCFSPGVGPSIAFEEALCKLSISCFLADASVEKPSFNNHLMYFDPIFISSVLTPAASLKEWINSKYKGKDDLLLQMDIEGSEWDVLINSDEETLNQFRIMAIEFHRMDILYSTFGLNIVKYIFSKLLKNHSIVHLHINNYVPFIIQNGIRIPPVLEITLLRNDRFRGIIKPIEMVNLPHPLDSDNCTWKPQMPFPNEWFYENKG
jgi:hypothetical protein